MNTARKFHLHDGQSGAALVVKIIKNPTENRIDKIEENGNVVIRLQSNLSLAECNKSIIDLLSTATGIHKDQFEIVVDDKSDRKIISIIGESPEFVINKLIRDL